MFFKLLQPLFFQVFDVYSVSSQSQSWLDFEIIRLRSGTADVNLGLTQAVKLQ